LTALLENALPRSVGRQLPVRDQVPSLKAEDVKMIAKLQAVSRRLRNETSISYEGKTSTDVFAGRDGAGRT
jgi:hypothetical protein